MDVGVWLRGLGFSHYEAVFRENEIDADVLPELTDSDLAELGVPLGDRKRLLRAIAALGPARTPSQSGSPPPAPLAQENAAERRQLTVMFCDIVGSTALSARLDPEDMREVIRAYQDACARAVARYDGFVAKFMGDGVLAYFGFPRAHEDNAERAVRAGLDISSAVVRLENGANEPLKVRIAIATGIVVVGDPLGQGSTHEQLVVGDTPNLAARLQALAEPGSVVIAESTRRLLGGTFELTPLHPHELKGLEAPIPAWTVVREAENVSRFEASRSQAMTPFVGREHEVALLLDRWREASGGEGQVALISGEPGIGKSRILAALSERIGSEPHVRVRYQCSPLHVNEAFYPISSQIRHAAGFVTGEPATARLDKLEAMIARSGLEPNGIAPFLAALLSIPGDERYPSLDAAPSEQKERTIAALMAVFAGLVNNAPVLAILEDAHWIDPTSLDVFGRLVDQLPNMRALLVVTFRPEFVAPWAGRAHVAALTLSRFGRRHALAMVDRIAGGKALPSEVSEEIVAKTDGVPLFVEELTKNVLESGLLREESGAYVLDRALSPLAIPSTLQELADGALGSSRAGEGDRADRGGDRARVLVSTAGCGRADPRSGLARRARPARCGGADPHSRRAAGGDLCVQACAGAGHGLRLAPAQPAAAHPCRHCERLGRRPSSIMSILRKRSSPIISPRRDFTNLRRAIGSRRPNRRCHAPPPWRRTAMSTPVSRCFRAFRKGGAGNLWNWRSWWPRRTHCCRSKDTARQRRSPR